MIFAKVGVDKTVSFGPVLAADGTMSNGAIAYTDAYILKNGTETALNGSATFTHKREGVYALLLKAADLDAVGDYTVYLNKNPLEAAPKEITVLAANVYNWLFGTVSPFDANLAKILGTALTESAGAGKLAQAFIKDYNVATPVRTAESVNQTADNNVILTNATYGNAAIRTAIDNVSVTITGAATQVFATANTLARGTGRQAASPFALGAPLSTFADTLATDTTWLCASPTTSATVNGIPNVTLWETLTFKCGASRANYASVIGYHSGGAAPRVVDCYYYDYVSTTWKLATSTSNRMNSAAADTAYGPWYLPPAAQKNLTAGDGEVQLAFVSLGSTTTDILHLNLVFISASTAGPTANEIANAVSQDLTSLFYSEGVWTDSVSGTAGTVLRTNGIRSNPCLTLADAMTIAASLGNPPIMTKPGATLTLDRNMAKLTMSGSGGWFLDMAGFDISGVTIRWSELITGASTAATSECFVWECQIGTSDWGEVDFHRCHVMDATIKLIADEPYLFQDCSFVPQASVPIIDFNSSAGNRRCVVVNSGGMVVIKNMVHANNVLLLHGGLDVTFDASCTAGTVYALGPMRITGGTGLTHLYHDDDDTDIQTLLARIPQVLSMAQIGGTGAYYAKALNSAGSVIAPTGEAAAALAALTGDTGITLPKALEMLAAFMSGKVTVHDNEDGTLTYTYLKRDGAATSFTSTCAIADGTRAATGALS